MKSIINKIKEIVNNDSLPEQYQMRLIYFILAEDKDSLKHILEILDHERKSNSELIKEMNLELSRADSVLNDTVLFKNKKDFVTGEIFKFYTKYKDRIGHCFKNKEEIK
jgi:hypothetical protein